MKKSIIGFFVFLLSIGLAQAQYEGGNGRGDVLSIKSTQALSGENVDVIYAGGNGRGDIQTTKTAQTFSGENVNVIYAGGNGRGDMQTTKTIQTFSGENVNVIYGGANGRGDVATVITSAFANCPNATWNGSVSDEWENPANWSCNALPGINSVVVIPSGVLNYPTISITTEVKSLEVRTGATITVKTGVTLKLNGQ